MMALNLLQKRVRISVSDPWEFQSHHPSVLFGEVVDIDRADTSRPILIVKLDQPLTAGNLAFPDIFALSRHKGKDLTELAAGEKVPFNFSTATDNGFPTDATGLAFIGAMQLAEYATDEPTQNNRRPEALTDLVHWRVPLDRLAARLAALEWDAEREVVVLTAELVLGAVGRFLSGASSAHELEVWANLIEGREDVGYASETVKDAIHVLANPLLNGKLTKSGAAELARQLSG